MKGPKNGFTRRDMALSALTATGAVVAQQTPTEDVTIAAREQLKRTTETLRKIEVPIATEPIFTFRA